MSTIKWKPLNLLPMIAVCLMAILGLISWWVVLAIGISQVEFK